MAFKTLLDKIAPQRCKNVWVSGKNWSIRCVVLVVFVTLDVCYCAEEDTDSSLLPHLPIPSASKLFEPAHIVTS